MVKSRTDQIQQIIDKRSRSEDSNRYTALKRRLNRILDTYSAIQESHCAEELFRYIPIALVGCMEGYFRRAIENLIDFKDEYRSQITEFNDLKFGAESVLAMQGQHITLGEFVAHLLPISSLEQVDSHITKLTGQKFIANVLKEESAVLEGSEVRERRLPKGTIKDVKETFRLRHIYCHELASGPPLDAGSTFVLLIDVVRFLEVSEQWIYKLTGPDPPLDEQMSAHLDRMQSDTSGE